jgi:hypothetical protein
MAHGQQARAACCVRAQQAPLFNNMIRRVDGLVVCGTSLGDYGNMTYATAASAVLHVVVLAVLQWLPCQVQAATMKVMYLS